MDHNFWHERWRTGAIPFHEGVCNQMLSRWFDALELEAGARVFVPLCGKTFDMYWLMERRCQVLGVELSDIAVEDFFSEHELPVTRSRDSRFEMYDAPGIKILCGDIFKLDGSDLASVHAVYDRASLVALPQDLRKSYVDHLLSYLPIGAPVLLVSFEYDTTRMEGPPFCVDEAEVRALYENRYTVRHLESREVIEEKPIFRERGLDSMIEHAFLCTDRS